MPDFRRMDKKDQAEATAVYIVEQRIEGYYASEQAKRADKDKHKADLAAKAPPSRR